MAPGSCLDQLPFEVTPVRCHVRRVSPWFQPGATLFWGSEFVDLARPPGRPAAGSGGGLQRGVGQEGGGDTHLLPLGLGAGIGGREFDGWEAGLVSRSPSSALSHPSLVGLKWTTEKGVTRF